MSPSNICRKKFGLTDDSWFYCSCIFGMKRFFTCCYFWYTMHWLFKYVTQMSWAPLLPAASILLLGAVEVGEKAPRSSDSHLFPFFPILARRCRLGCLIATTVCFCIPSTNFNLLHMYDAPLQPPESFMFFSHYFLNPASVPPRIFYSFSLFAFNIV